MLPKLLIVNDDPKALHFIEKTLSFNYTLLKAENEKTTFQILETEAVQLVIFDVTMQKINGFELCKLMKNRFNYSHIPVLLLTEKDILQSKIKGLEMGADAYIEKPFLKEYLQAQITSLLNNREKIRAFYAGSPLVHIKTSTHSKGDERFLETLNDAICKNLEDATLDVEKLAKHMNMSRITLYRKIKAISLLTPVEVINSTRLKKAAELLSEGDHKIYEIADKVGFSSQSNFARNFLKHFNITPSQYMQSKQLKRKSI